MRYSISTVLFLTTIAAVLSASVASDSKLGAVVVHTLFYLNVLTCILVAIHETGYTRSFCIGVVLFGASYAMLSGMAGRNFVDEFYLHELGGFFLQDTVYDMGFPSYSAASIRGVIGIVFSCVGGFLGVASFHASTSNRSSKEIR